MKRILAAMLLAGILFSCKKDKIATSAKNPWITNSPRIYFEGSYPSVFWSEIYSVNLDGSDQQRHTFVNPFDMGTASVSNFSFSPDGNTIAFLSSIDNNYSGIYVMNINDPDNFIKIIPNNIKGSVMQTPEIFDNGRKIVYVHEVDSFWNRHGEIFTANIDGSNIRLLTTPIVDNAYNPSVSPDNKTIVFNNLQNLEMKLFTMDVDGTNKKEIAPGYPESKRHPQFSPNGSKIVCSGGYRTIYAKEIFIMNADGTNVKQLTNFSNNFNLKSLAWDPTFSKDNNTIYFCASESEYAITQLYKINADGTGLVKLTAGKDLDKYAPSIK